MIWTVELAATLEDAPWPATRNELIEWAERNGCPQQVIDNLYELDEEDDTPYESIEEIWPDYIMKEDSSMAKKMKDLTMTTCNILLTPS